MAESGASSTVLSFIFKDGLFSETELRAIKQLSPKDLDEALTTTVDRNRFRTKFFNSQLKFANEIDKKTDELLESLRTPKAPKKKRTQGQVIQRPVAHDHLDEKWSFMENIQNATPEQMNLVEQEGIRLGISMVQTTPNAPIENPSGVGELDENFGEDIALLFSNPQYTSTPTHGRKSLQQTGNVLETIEEEVPEDFVNKPAPVVSVENFLDSDNQHDLVALPATPGQDPMLNIPQGALEVIPEENPLNPDVQPDFVALRQEAIQRHVVNAAPAEPSRPVNRRRRPLRNWNIPAETYTLTTEEDLLIFLQPFTIFGDNRHHPYSFLAIPLPVNDSLHTSMQVSNLIPVASTSKESHPQVQSHLIINPQLFVPQQIPEENAAILENQYALPPVPESALITPAPIVQSIIAEEAQPLIIPAEQASRDVLPETSKIVTPATGHKTPRTPQVLTHAPPAPPVPVVRVPSVYREFEKIEKSLSDIDKERIKYILNMLEQQDRVSIDELKEDFRTRQEMAGVFVIGLRFNNILWKMKRGEGGVAFQGFEKIN